MTFTAQHRALLGELAAFEVCGPFEDNLYRLTRMAGELLEADRVSLMLLDSGQSEGKRLKLVALYGVLPQAASREESVPGQGIAGQVFTTGQTLRVERIEDTPWRDKARRPEEGGSFLACPVLIAGEPAGVLNFSAPRGRTVFTESDQALGELATLLLARAIQVARLERMLDSRFAQLAFALEGSSQASAVTALSAHEPERVAKMLAKGFYKELRHCGFTPNQIIHAAGEIISELTGSLNRHTKRLVREQG
ncbi:MAG: GAF domain-containing protein [Pseudomonadota bacterium]